MSNAYCIILKSGKQPGAKQSTGIFNFADVSIIIGPGSVWLISFLDRKDREMQDFESAEAAAADSSSHFCDNTSF